jgi:hypothetical protein
MNEHDAELYAEDKGIEDGATGKWEPPFRRDFCGEFTEIYELSWWNAFAMRTIEEEFPNG